MPSNTAPETEIETLGSHLREQRERKGLTLEEMSVDTRISLVNLRAMEADDHDSLPAEAFARGYYTICADRLGLDRAEILSQFDKARNSGRKKKKVIVLTPTQKSDSIKGMANPAPVSLKIVFQILLGIALLMGVIAAWYASWNPLNTARGLFRPSRQEITTTLQRPTTTPDDLSGHEPETVFLQVPASQFIQPPYVLEATVPTRTTVTIQIDNLPEQQEIIEAETTARWQAQQAIRLVLPIGTRADVLINDITFPLPQTVDQPIELSFPEDLIH